MTIDSLILSNTFHLLECHITTNTDINTTNTDISSIVNVSWYRDNGNENRVVSDSEGVSILSIVAVTDTSFNSTLRFSPITSSTPMSTLGNYTCEAWIGEQSVRSKASNNVQVMMKSKFYSKDIVQNYNFINFILVPNTVKPVISPLKPYQVGSDVTCSVTYPNNNNIGVDTNLNLQWSNLSNHVFASSSTHLTNNPTAIHYTISNLSNAGQYNCSSFINTTNHHDYILTSNTMTSFVNVTVISK